MKHSRPDYDRIQDPAGLIPEDEPVFLLRAQDITAPDVLDHWVMLARDAGADPKIVDQAKSQAQAMWDWQNVHGWKVPDS